MALAASLVGSGEDSSNPSVSTSGSVTRVANRLYLAVVYSYKSGGTPGVPAVSGFTQVVTSTNSHRRVTILRYLSASPPGAGVITATFGGINQTNAFIDVIEWTGVDISGTNGSGAIAQSKDAAGADNRAIIILSSDFADAGDKAMFAVINEGASMSPDGTQLNTHLVTSVARSSTEWESDKSGFVGFGSIDFWAGVGVEIKTGTKTMPLGVASETDSTILIVPFNPHFRQIGIAEAANDALSMTRRKIARTGQALSGETALPIRVSRIYRTTILDLEADVAAPIDLYPITEP